MSSIKGKADLWRTGKNGASPGPRSRAPGGGDDFQAPAKYSRQFKGTDQHGNAYDKRGGGGMNAPSALDNQGVFANSIAGLAKGDKAFMPDPGTGRDGLDMYSIKSSAKETDFGMDMAKAPTKKYPGEF